MSRNKKLFRLITKKSVESSIKNRNSWTFTIAVLGITITVCFLLITGKVNIDSSTLLSLILAFFSIYLSSQFYFKATEQSNQFYNTAFNHNKNISESLSGMKGEFGTSLRMIEESSNYLKGKFDELGKVSESIDSLNEVQEKVKKGFESLYEKSGITADEKSHYDSLLKAQSKIVHQLDEKLKEVEIMDNNTISSEIKKYRSRRPLPTFFFQEFYDVYGDRISKTNVSKNSMNKMFHEFKKNHGFEPSKILLMRRYELIDSSGNLTSKGYRLILKHFNN